MTPRRAPWQAAFAGLREMDAVFSTYRSDSDLMRLRREEITISECSPLVTRALEIGDEAARLTRGAFTTLLPAGDGDLVFDPTGLVKGWAVDRAATLLAGLAGVSFCINAGGDLPSAPTPTCPAADPTRSAGGSASRTPRPVEDRHHRQPDPGCGGDVGNGRPRRPPLRPGDGRAGRPAGSVTVTAPP